MASVGTGVADYALANREDNLAELVSTGVAVHAAGERLGLTRGQTARTWANIKAGLGEEQCR